MKLPLFGYQSLLFSLCQVWGIDVSIGQPVSAEGRDPGELMEEIERWIEAEMRRLDPEAYAKPTQER